MSPAMEQSSQVDLRGFTYALEPLQQKQLWQMEQLQCELAQAQAVWLAAKDELLKLELTLRDLSDAARQLLQKKFDPQTHRQTLAYLVQLRQQVEESVQIEAQLRATKETIFSAVVEQQKKLDALVEHKNTEVLEYVKERSRLDQMQMDRDWIARTHFTETIATKVGIDAQEWTYT